MIGGVSVFRFRTGTCVARTGRRFFFIPIEAAIRSHFRKQPHGVGAGLSFGIGRVQFDDLDVVTQDQQTLFVGGRVQQFADVAPGADERLRVIADAFHRFATFLDLSQSTPDIAFFRFEPTQFVLDAGQSVRPETFEHLDEAADVRLRLLLLATQNVRLLIELLGLAVKAGDGSLDDLLAGFEGIADFTNPADHRVFQGLGGYAGSGARILSAFVALPGAEIVVMGAVSAGRGIADHVCPA